MDFNFQFRDNTSTFLKRQIHISVNGTEIEVPVRNTHQVRFVKLGKIRFDVVSLKENYLRIFRFFGWKLPIIKLEPSIFFCVRFVSFKHHSNGLMLQWSIDMRNFVFWWCLGDLTTLLNNRENYTNTKKIIIIIT